MKSCEDCQELISRLLDGDLSANERSELERHAASCPDCAALLAAFQAVSDALVGDEAEPPARLHENIMAEVRRDAIRHRQAPKRVRSFLAMAACAALVILAAANLPRLGRSAPTLGAAAKSAASEEAVYAVPAAAPEEPALAADYAPAEPAARERFAGASRGEADLTADTAYAEEASKPEAVFSEAEKQTNSVYDRTEAPASPADDAPESKQTTASARGAEAEASLAEADFGADFVASEEASGEAEAERSPVLPLVLLGLLILVGALLFLGGRRRGRR